MSISNFFNSYIGMYIAQSICHALIAAIIVDRSIQAWKINNPLIKQRFRYIVIISPILSFPVYQTINSGRGSVYFRLEALFDINRWLSLELWGKFPLSLLFIIILFITTLISFLQEIIPILRHTIESKESTSEGETPDDNSIVSKALESLPVEKPDIFIIDDNDFILFSTTGKNTAIFLSTGLVKMLNIEQIQAALAHEIAHITRSRQPLILMLFLLRISMFFNPIVLVEFRKIVQEDEQICDNIAVTLTGKPYALIETLKKLYYTHEDIAPVQITKPSKIGAALEEYSHNMLIKNRIMQLEQGLAHEKDGGWFKFIVTFIVITIINYFIV